MEDEQGSIWSGDVLKIPCLTVLVDGLEFGNPGPNIGAGLDGRERRGGRQQEHSKAAHAGE
jgi:hypothetical protein